MKSGNDSTPVLSVFIMQCGTCCTKQWMSLLTFEDIWTYHIFCKATADSTTPVWRQLLLITPIRCSTVILNQTRMPAAQSPSPPTPVTRHTLNLTQGRCSERSAKGFTQPFHSESRLCFSSSHEYSKKGHFEALQAAAARMTRVEVQSWTWAVTKEGEHRLQPLSYTHGKHTKDSVKHIICTLHWNLSEILPQDLHLNKTYIACCLMHL